MRLYAIGMLDAAVCWLRPCFCRRPSACQPPPRPPPKPSRSKPRRSKIGQLSDRVTAIGTLRSNEAVVIRPEIAGRVVSINFKEGERVEKGDALIALDDSIYRAELDQVKAQLQLAERNFKRIDELYDRKVATSRSRDEVESGLAVGSAAVSLAQARLDKTVIRAPFSGIVGLRNVSVGDYVTVGQDIVNLVDIDPSRSISELPKNSSPSFVTDRPSKSTSMPIPDAALRARSTPSTRRSTKPAAASSSGRAFPTKTAPSSPVSSRAST